jgi:hypothetical protein
MFPEQTRCVRDILSRLSFLLRRSCKCNDLHTHLTVAEPWLCYPLNLTMSEKNTLMYPIVSHWIRLEGPAGRNCETIPFSIVLIYNRSFHYYWHSLSVWFLLNVCGSMKLMFFQALLSVYDKTDLLDLAKGLPDAGV